MCYFCYPTSEHIHNILHRRKFGHPRDQRRDRRPAVCQREEGHRGQHLLLLMNCEWLIQGKNYSIKSCSQHYSINSKADLVDVVVGSIVIFILCAVYYSVYCILYTVVSSVHFRGFLIFPLGSVQCSFVLAFVITKELSYLSYSVPILYTAQEKSQYA